MYWTSYRQQILEKSKIVLCYIAVHKIEVSDDVRCGVLAFRAVTGCDSISQFWGKSKKMAWKIFCAVPHLMAELGGTYSPTVQTFSAAEEFVCRLYNPFGDTNVTPSLRCTQFRKGAGKLENLPPTCDALRHHILRAIISGFYLENIIRCKPADTLPNNKWLDFESDYSLTPIFMTQDCVAATACRCKEGGHHCRTGHCSCQKSRVRCTRVCGDWCRNPCDDDADSD